MKQLGLLLLLISFCSCTITKRHFGNGYHIEWRKKFHESTLEPNALKEFIPDAENKSEEPENQKDTISKIEVNTLESAAEDVLVTKKEDERALRPAETIKQKSEEKIAEDSETTEVATPRMHPLTWGIWGMWSISIVCMFFVTFYAEALIGVGLGFFIAMIFAFIIIRSLRKHPEKYRLKKLSYGFIIPAIILGGISLAGLGLFLLMLFA